MNDEKCDLVYDYHNVDGVHFICAGDSQDRQNACFVSVASSYHGHSCSIVTYYIFPSSLRLCLHLRIESRVNGEFGRFCVFITSSSVGSVVGEP